MNRKIKYFFSNKSIDACTEYYLRPAHTFSKFVASTFAGRTEFEAYVSTSAMSKFVNSREFLKLNRKYFISLQEQQQMRKILDNELSWRNNVVYKNYIYYTNYFIFLLYIIFSIRLD